MIYKDNDITVTNEFIRLKDFESEAIPIKSINEVSINKEITGNYRNAAILFFIIGIVSIWFMIGFLFIAWGIAAWFTKTYQYALMIKRNGQTYRVLVDKKRKRIGHVCSIVNALILSEKIKSDS